MRLTLAAAAIGLAFSAPALADNATINQGGIDNYASIDQGNADASVARIVQTGNRNQAGSPADGELPAVQGIRQLNATVSRADIEQRGDDNRATIDQQNVHNSFWTRITQGESFASHRIFGAIVQSALSNWYAEIFVDRGNDNFARITQTGDAQTAEVVQGAYRWNGSFYEFTQTPANNNTASIGQTGERQNSLVNQLGDWNQGTTIQAGRWNEAFILQEGNFNVASVVQTGTGASFADRNVARITQSGTNHVGSALQNGMGNTALINQH
jgi:hypothetical protein